MSKKTNKKRNKGGKSGKTKPVADTASGKVIDTAYDPKNREVTLLQIKGKFKVIKPATGFTSSLTDEDSAAEIFASQRADSHNQ